uniref:Bacteriophage T5 Orf172 DNA-binding domain-containing protein n=1 Tax=Megaviridae environmental sample TaxID=1737588 RepID=A0A5J6VIQ7_9VIRU|nr:MAG: hypothetical protein [Megaviridae environmental sample]
MQLNDLMQLNDNTIITMTSKSNSVYRELCKRELSCYIDVLYVLLITLDDSFDANHENEFFKIGTTTVDRIEKRFTEHYYDFGKQNVIQVINIYEIPHSKVEKNFHIWMNQNKNSMCMDVDINGVKKRECYLYDVGTLEHLEFFLQLNNIIM